MYCRLLHRDDLASCVALLGTGFRAAPHIRSAMPAVWDRLLVREQLGGTVVLDSLASDRASIVAFGMTVFLAPGFLEEYLSRPRPYLNALVYEAILSGRSPVLDAPAIRCANTQGTLNLLILHFGMRLSEPPRPRDLAIIEAAHRGFQAVHAGYRVSRVVQEAYGSHEVAFLEAGGLRLVDDFRGHGQPVGTAEHSKDNPDAHCETPSAEQPYLMVADQNDAVRRLPGSTISVLFRHAVPRFRFSPAERRLLQWTLLDEDDRTVARALNVSPDAVKKRWRRIYERVAAIDGSVVEDGAGALPGEGAGTHKRRRLLRYLRAHPEELRPFVYDSR